jgi:hypothetical protein
MPDEITIKPKSESTPASATSDNQTASLVRAQLVNLCALGLGVSFFLPWAQVLFRTVSGFDLQKAGDEQLLLWLIPIFCVITIFAGITKQKQNFVARVTGLLPFIILTYWFNKIGSDVGHILTYGAYLSLIFGTGLLVLPGKSK